jgi:uncharacterized protein (TIGR04255 family)
MDPCYTIREELKLPRTSLMSKIRHLRSAPITEAIFDIRVKAREGFDVAEFANLRQDLAQTFPIVEEIRGSEVHFEVSAKEARPPEIRDLGVRGLYFKTQDGLTIAQCRVDGFTLNKLRPYTSWDELRSLAESLWRKYYTIAQPEGITRIALRYINQISIDERYLDFEDYLTASPSVPKELPQNIGQFLYQTTIVDNQNEIQVNVAQVFQPPPPTSTGIIIILDIDAYKEIFMAVDDPLLFEHLARLRDMKNRVFFSYLTERTIGLFE